MRAVIACFLAAAVTQYSHAAVSTGAAQVSVLERGTREDQESVTRRAPTIIGKSQVLPKWRGGSTDIKVRGLVSIAGGFLAHLVLGTIYCWGNFLSYAPKSLLYIDGLGPEAHIGETEHAVFVMPITILIQCFGMQLGGKSIKAFGTSATTVIGSAVVALGVFLASFQTRLIPFMLCYAGIIGLGIGTAYNAPMVAGWTWFPGSKGSVNGIVLVGFGAGAYLFNMIGTSLMNPEGLSAPFPDSVSAAFPSTLRRLSLIYIIMTTVGGLLVKSAPKDELTVSKGQDAADEITLGQAVSSRKFWTLWAMIICTSMPGLNIMNLYKKFAMGQEALNNDKFLSLIGGLGAIFNGFGRIFWATLVDKFGFEKPYSALALVTSLLMFLMPMVTSNRKLFSIVICLIFFCTGGNFSMFPTINAATFGVVNAAQIYGVLFSAFACSAIGGAQVTNTLLKSSGWNTVFKSMMVLSLVSVGLVKTLN
mmetsp:Transcript_36089/g.48823  ORF Transcript_36089/g.48823 Transcript_36089/m.48823 type:complete len:477 (-) Transcript_36089:284-1714(-)|eukprot:CAMPEP_0185778120 /NCGR_PEP_ID=MMETSP1174-20130828/91596_1 /TAXON_ID=35687 /ORGANISM="Dictyocha speculum, Strain CCMP1381" /LENGTH=476 /DNA_ID=CAMNT_0028466727 /DNA_START=19 /DNA_END=1449 /DNA_ORIENTATION=+